MEKLLFLAQKIIGAQETEKSADLLAREIAEQYDLPYIAIFSVSTKGNPSLVYGYGLGGDELVNIKLLSMWEEVAYRVVYTGEAVFETDRDDLLKEILGIPLITYRGLRGVIVLASEKTGKLTKDMWKKIAVLSLPLTAELVSAELYGQLEDLFLSTVLALASAVDAKHPYTRGHSERVTRYATAIGKQMGLSNQEMKNLRLSALLHDVGKIGISESVLDKNGKLTEEEYAKIKEHPVIGAEIVGKIANSSAIVPGILEHHERYDGKGYPHGKKGEEISLFGRIIAIADTFDAMTSTRSYRKALPFQVAVEEIVYNAGYQFDPKIVKYFVQAYEKDKDIWQRENIIYSVR